MGYNRIPPRSWPLEQDEEKRGHYLEALVKLENNPTVEIWYQDEWGVQGDPKPRAIWAKIGSQPRIHYSGGHIQDNVLGAVRPLDGKFVSIIMPEVNTPVFQIFLDKMQQHLTGNKRYVMILDNASWHKTEKLNWGKLEPLFLPPYSPDYNPIERIWLNRKTDFFACFATKVHLELTNRLQQALRYYMKHRKACRTICYR